MRVTYRGSRNYKSNKHNDRNFDTTKAEHIDADLEKFNLYWHPFSKKNPNMTFEEAEKKAYKMLYDDYLKKQNQKHIERRQYNRCRTIDDVLKNKNTKPEEVILQIGNREECPEPRILAEAWKELNKKLNEWNAKTGKHCKMISFAGHMDEETPHIHMRRTWAAYDKELGCYVPKQDLALEQAGVPLPYPDKPKSRTNNRKITFDKMVRGWWQEICINKGLNIETEPLPSRKHKGKEEYINEKIQAKHEELNNLIRDVETTKQLEKELHQKHKETEAFYDKQIQAKQDEYDRINRNVQVAKRVEQELKKTNR